jgi:hypothetical protein
MRTYAGLSRSIYRMAMKCEGALALSWRPNSFKCAEVHPRAFSLLPFRGDSADLDG